MNYEQIYITNPECNACFHNVQMFYGSFDVLLRMCISFQYPCSCLFEEELCGHMLDYFVINGKYCYNHFAVCVNGQIQKFST